MKSESKKKPPIHPQISVKHVQEWFHKYCLFLESRKKDPGYPPRTLAEFDRPKVFQEELPTPSQKKCQQIATILNGGKTSLAFLEGWRQECKAYAEVAKALRALINRLIKKHKGKNPYIQAILLKNLTPPLVNLQMQVRALINKIYRFTKTPHKGIETLRRKARSGSHLTPSEIKLAYQQSTKLRETIREDVALSIADVIRENDWDYPATIGQILRAWGFFRQALGCEDLSFADLPCLKCKTFPLPGVCPKASSRIEQQLWKARKRRNIALPKPHRS